MSLLRHTMQAQSCLHKAIGADPCPDAYKLCQTALRALDAVQSMGNKDKLKADLVSAKVNLNQVCERHDVVVLP